jgi:hypothetical protein
VQHRREQFIRRHLATLWHPAGGVCAGAALDASLHVRASALLPMGSIVDPLKPY